MSNVLIGIIGVILFIGLALAGALILGEDFKTSSNTAKASTYVQQVKQTADAMTMWELKTGQTLVKDNGTSTTFLVPRFLKVDNPNVRVFSWSSTPRSVTFTNLPDDSPQSRAICGEVQRQTGQIGPSDEPAIGSGSLFDAAAAFPAGCIRNGAAATPAPLIIFSRY